ncbi:hypothetical protein M7I_6183 [Glarea lozoyensis 74030]|uniref:Uncharacterized protein n=1 Tax=Glarea lozoyensis (strain ATCC 74030 / MF5533) TaxID=1104152 RepID=H0ETW2_GLAL7|nr:hypothetical protein M7I_6183 [Glarea lozoyensis 74030]
MDIHNDLEADMKRLSNNFLNVKYRKSNRKSLFYFKGCPVNLQRPY